MPASRRIDTVGYPDKFYLARKYGEGGPLRDDLSLSASDRLLMWALLQQAEKGPCREARASIWEASEAKAKWKAWRELGERGSSEAMFLYVQALDEFAPQWWEWPALGLDDNSEAIL